MEDSINRFSEEKGFLEINADGHLEFDGIDCVELAQRFGTPLHVISKKKILENYSYILNGFKSIYTDTDVAYAVKANPLLSVCKIMYDAGSMLEVISFGELLLANLVGVSPSKLIYNGNYKSRESINQAVRMGVLINIDSFKEIEVVSEQAKKLGIHAKVGLRINPVVKTGTGDMWETALEESKFGISIQEGFEAYKKAKEMQNLDVIAVHAHIGSQIEDSRPYKIACERVVEFTEELNRKLGLRIYIVDMGGGFPVPFRYKKTAPIENYAEAIAGTLREAIDKTNLLRPKLIIEPGGSLVGDSSILLLRVGVVKNRESTRRWAIVDGGANVNMRATQGWYKYQFVCCNKMKGPNLKKYNIGGPLCFAGDVLAFDRMLPELEEEDILACLDSGAYTLSTENRYNSHPLPTVVMIEETGIRIVRRREGLFDLARSVGEEMF